MRLKGILVSLILLVFVVGANAQPTGELAPAPIWLRSALSSTATGLTYTAATGVISLTSGYTIPTTTQINAWNAKQSALTAGTDYQPPPGTTVSASGPVGVAAALAQKGQTYVATAAVTYTLPTGDLSAYIGAVSPLTPKFVKAAAGTLTIDPGTGNFIAEGGAGKTMTNSVAGETYATMTLQLVSSAASVNKWVVVGGHGTWVMTP